MPGNDPADGPTLPRETRRFVETRAEALGTTTDDVLKRLVAHYQTACEDGLSCPHCNNDLRVSI